MHQGHDGRGYPLDRRDGCSSHPLTIAFAFVSTTEQLLDLALLLNPGYDRQRRAHVAMLAARLGYIAVHVPVRTESAPSEGGGAPIDSACSELEDGELDRLVQAAAPAMVVLDDGSERPGVVRRNDPVLVSKARAQIDAVEDARPLIVAVPISIGRTRNEAVARAAREPRFAGDRHPSMCGIFGTFEQAQEQVLELARAGAEVLLVDIPDDVDVADVLAQVRALVVGATPALLDR